MNQSERRLYLIDSLLEEKEEYRRISKPQNADGQRTLLRSLMNVRMASPVSEEFLAVQNDYLHEETKEKGITDIADLTPVREDMYIWQGDITTLK